MRNVAPCFYVSPPPPTEVRSAVVEVGHPWSSVTVKRKLPPLKYYYDLEMSKSIIMYITMYITCIWRSQRVLLTICCQFRELQCTTLCIIMLSVWIVASCLVLFLEILGQVLGWGYIYPLLLEYSRMRVFIHFKLLLEYSRMRVFIHFKLLLSTWRWPSSCLYSTLAFMVWPIVQGSTCTYLTWRFMCTVCL